MGIDANMFGRVNRELTNPKEDPDLRELCVTFTQAFGPNPIRLVMDDDRIATLEEEFGFNYGWELGLEPNCHDPKPDIYDAWPSLDGQGWSDKLHFTVHTVRGRWYDLGYERGSWPYYALVAGWLQHHIPGIELLYCPDSGGAEAVVLSDAKLGQLTRHWLLYGDQPYHRNSNSGGYYKDYNDVNVSHRWSSVPWYSLTYHLWPMTEDRGATPQNCDSLPEPDPLENYPELMGRFLRKTKVKEHRRALLRALGHE